MSDRERFIRRIRRALGRDENSPVAPPPDLDESRVRQVADADDLASRFLAAVVEVGGEALHAPTALIPATVVARLVELEVASVVLDLDARRLGLEEACERAGISVLPSEEVHVAGAGITGVAAAVAETGTVVVDSAPGAPRGVSLLPPVHVAVLEAGQILPDLVDLLRLEGKLPSSRVWITGPSKTADIEGILVTGVHGPGRWIVALATGG